MMAYTYLIGWRSLDIWYYGARTANKVTPENDLWVNYFTSSKNVKVFRKEHGEPDVIRVHKTFSTKEDTLAYEERFIDRVNAVESKRWMNRCRGHRKFYVEPKQSEEHIIKRKKALKGRKPGFIGKKHSPETLEKMRVSRLAYFERAGKRTGWVHSKETKEKMSNSRKEYLERLKHA